MDEPWSSSEERGAGDGPGIRRAGPRDGPRVLILRPEGQVSRLRELLEARGARTTSVPLMQIVPPESYVALDGALAELAGYDWVVLTSANAVDAVSARLPAGARIVRLAVIGAATLARVLEVGLPEPELAPVLVPPRAVAESLAEELEPRVRELVLGQGRARVLLPRAEQARDVLPDRLRRAGAAVTIAPAYRNRIPAESNPRLRALFARREDWPDAIPFTSSSSVTHLMEVLRAAGQELPPGILRVSIGPVTSATLREQGLPPHAEAAEATVDSLAEAVLAAVGRGHAAES